MIDATADQPHYCDHLAPIWHALPDTMRGRFWVPASLRTWLEHAHGIRSETSPPDRGRILMAASARELRRARHDLRVLVEHGTGQTYSGAHPYGYADSDPPWVDVHLVPSARVARQRGPKARIVGCPRLDRYSQNVRVVGSSPLVAFTWHWPCDLLPETGWAWPHYAQALKAIANDPDRGYRLAGHAHPRIAPIMRAVYDELAIPWISADQLLTTADVLVADNTSLGWEFASLDRPIIWCNTPEWRRHVHHGLRFWSHADIGIQVDDPDQLHGAIVRTLEQDPHRMRRHAMIPHLYAHPGAATRVAVDTLLEVHG